MLDSATTLVAWPVAGLVAGVGLVAFWMRRRHVQVVSRRTPGVTLDRVDDADIEKLVRESFRLQGYQPVEGAQGREARGEIVLRRERETVLVRFTNWRSAKVGSDQVQAMQSAMTARHANAGFILCTGRFSRDAMAVAGPVNIRLIGGEALQGLLEKARRAQALRSPAD